MQLHITELLTAVTVTVSLHVSTNALCMAVPQKTRILETVFQTPMDTAYGTQTAFIDNDINFLNIRCQIWVTLHDHSSIIKLWPVECSMFYVVLSLL